MNELMRAEILRRAGLVPTTTVPTSAPLTTTPSTAPRNFTATAHSFAPNRAPRPIQNQPRTTIDSALQAAMRVRQIAEVEKKLKLQPLPTTSTPVAAPAALLDVPNEPAARLKRPAPDSASEARKKVPSPLQSVIQHTTIFLSQAHQTLLDAIADTFFSIFNIVTFNHDSVPSHRRCHFAEPPAGTPRRATSGHVWSKESDAQQDLALMVGGGIANMAGAHIEAEGLASLPQRTLGGRRVVFGLSPEDSDRTATTQEAQTGPATIVSRQAHPTTSKPQQLVRHRLPRRATRWPSRPPPHSGVPRQENQPSGPRQEAPYEGLLHQKEGHCLRRGRWTRGASSLGQSKQVERRCRLHPPHPRRVTCPVAALKSHLTRNNVGPDEFIFTYVSSIGNRAGKRTMLTKDAFMKRLNYILEEILGRKGLKGHSLRIGGATQLLMNGIPPMVVQAIGRWASDSFMVYWRHVTVILAKQHMAHKIVDAPLLEDLYHANAEAAVDNEEEFVIQWEAEAAEAVAKAAEAAVP
ncbi:hypothetical protein P7C70_g2949, partial [Phenoliferia sp. Uapishka_3]